MPDISASMVKELREKTDAPMMECKKALTEAAGDLQKAEEILRVRLGSKASKAALRVAAEGVVAIATRESFAAIVELNCETDFVAKNDDFLGFAADLARIAMDQASVTTVDVLSAQPLSGQTSSKNLGKCDG